jgi:hypothetical protein
LRDPDWSDHANINYDLQKMVAELSAQGMEEGEIS